MPVGLLSFGAYLPQSRLQRAAIAAAHSWFEPSLKGLGRGERTMGSWDEDSNTMAVEAGRACLRAADREAVAALYVASTSFPFLDRQNAGLVGEALGLPGTLQAMDVSGSQKAGTSALLTALQAAAGGRQCLVIGSDKRRAKAASAAEMLYGDGAAALSVGAGDDLLAELVGSHSRSVDFVDHFRTAESEFDYTWEARWVRDEGLMKIVPEAVTGALTQAGCEAADIAHFCCPVGSAREQQSLARKLGVDSGALADSLQDNCGHTGTAHALLQLVGALEKARAGELILVLGFGQGCDVLLFRATDKLAGASRDAGLAACLAKRREEPNYFKYLAFNELIALDHGLRAETDKNTGLSTAYRNRALTTAFMGGKCRVCGTLQIPAAPICVRCNAVDSQDPHPFAEASAFLKSYTADSLTYTINPPACYGMVQFDAGGRIMIDFTDVLPERELEVGMAMRMVFRVKDYDRKRGFRRYYWKAAPVYPG